MTFPLRLLLAPLALLLSLPGWLSAQQLDPTFHIPAIYRASQTNDAVQLADGRYVVGGGFTQVNGLPIIGLARLDAAGNLDLTYRPNSRLDTVQALQLCPLANGKLLVQGNYLAGSIRRRNVFRLNADGSLDPSFTLAPLQPIPYPNTPYYYPTIYQLAEQLDGRVLMLRNGNTGGSELVRFNSDGSVDATFAFSFPYTGYPTSLAVQADGNILLSGDFTTVNGVQRPYLARLNPSGSLDPSFQPTLSSPVTLLALDAAGRLLVRTEGASSGGTAYGLQGLKRLLPSGAPDPTFTVDASLAGRAYYQVAVLSNGNLAIQLADNATSFGSQLTCLLPSGALNPAFQPGSGPDYPLAGIRAVAGGGLLGWGGFQNLDGQRRTLALLDATGTLAAGFAPLLQWPGLVTHLVRQADGKVLIAGSFNSLDGHMTDGIGRLLPDGQPDLTFSWRQLRSSTWQTNALASQAGGRVLLAGTYRDGLSGNTYRGVLQQLTATGAPDASFVPALTMSTASYRPVSLLAALPGGQLLVGGDLTDALNRRYLTRLTSTGSADATFTPSASQLLVTGGLVQADSRILTTVAAADYSTTLQRLQANGQPDVSFIYAPLTPTRYSSGPSLVFELPASGHYLAVEPYSMGDVMHRLAATGADVPSFGTPYTPRSTSALPSSGINAAVELPDGRLLVGGAMQTTYQSTSTTPRTPLARLLANGQRDATFNFSFIEFSSTNPQTVQALCVQPDGKALVGGQFWRAGGQAVTGLVRLAAPTPLATTASQRSAAQAWPVPAREVLHVALAAAARPQRVALLNALGQAVLTRPVTQPELTLPTAGLPAGFYLLRVEYADGVATRPVTIE